MTQAGIRTLVVVLVVIIVLVVLFFLLRPESPVPESSKVGDAQEEPVALAINVNSMFPEEISVAQADEVNLQITSDHPVEVHLHGYARDQGAG